MPTATDHLREMIATIEPGSLPDLTVALAGLEPLPATIDRPLTVAEAAELTGLTGHTLRYYERIGLVAVQRDPAGNRAYDLDALARIVFITRLRLSGMPIRTIARYIELVGEGAGTVEQRLQILTDHRAQIETQLRELQFSLAVIDYKITTYGGDCGPPAP